MSQQFPVILYVGDAESAEALNAFVSPRGWYVAHAEELMDALAQYVHLMPDMVVLQDDPQSPLAQDACFHLESVHAQPLLVLSDTPGRWSDAVHVHPTRISLQGLIDNIRELVASEHSPILG